MNLSNRSRASRISLGMSSGSNASLFGAGGPALSGLLLTGDVLRSGPLLDVVIS